MKGDIKQLSLVKKEINQVVYYLIFRKKKQSNKERN
jgi:hypothetical protein